MAGPRSKRRGTPGYQKAWDAVARTVLSSPLHFLMSRWMLVMEITGRRTGKLYRVPVGCRKSFRPSVVLRLRLPARAALRERQRQGISR
jgi:hypothetical protein